MGICSIIGWEWARRRPLQLTARFPRLLAIDADDVASKASTGDYPAAAIRCLSPSHKLTADREFVRAYLLSVIQGDASLNSTEDVLAATTMKSVIGDPDVDWKDLVVRSCFSKGLHKWMVEQSWLVHITKGNGVLPTDEGINKEIDDFVKAMDEDGSMAREELAIVESEKR